MTIAEAIDIAKRMLSDTYLLAADEQEAIEVLAGHAEDTLHTEET